MILAVNTSTLQFSLALMDEEGTILAECLISSALKNFTGFMPALHSLLTSSGTDIHDIKCIIVAIGPGSFTGLRVGLSMCKGLAQGLEVGIIGVSSLEAIGSQMPFTLNPLCSMIHSRKAEVFLSLFRWDENHGLVRIGEDTCLKIKDLPTVIHETTIFLGNDFNNQGSRIKEIFGNKALLAPPHLWNLRASAVGSLGLRRFLKDDFDDLQDLVPSYMRSPDIRPSPVPLLSEDPMNRD